MIGKIKMFSILVLMAVFSLSIMGCDISSASSLTLTADYLDGGIDNQVVESGSVLDMEACIPGNDHIIAFTMGNDGDAALEIESISISGDPTLDMDIYELPNLPATIEVGETAPFSFSFAPDEEKEYEAVITIVTNDPDNGTFTVAVKGDSRLPKPSMTLMANYAQGGIENRVFESESVLDMGFCAPTYDYIAAFTMKNDGLADLVIESISTSGDPTNDMCAYEYPSLPVTIAPGSSVPFSFSFAPDEEKAYEVVLSIVSNDPVNPTTSVTIKGDSREPIGTTLVFITGMWTMVDSMAINVYKDGELIDPVPVGTHVKNSKYLEFSNVDFGEYQVDATIVYRDGQSYPQKKYRKTGSYTFTMDFSTPFEQWMPFATSEYLTTSAKVRLTGDGVNDVVGDTLELLDASNPSFLYKSGTVTMGDDGVPYVLLEELDSISGRFFLNVTKNGFNYYGSKVVDIDCEVPLEVDLSISKSLD
ncbi:MAG: choice-of-anchor D domain-containing protein [bacterium]|nr:choice-of-anchor D domain-containing protein [bacterium]